MCFGMKGSGTPSYVKKDYGALPSLGTGSASKTVTLNKAPAPMRGSRTGSSSYEANSPINISTGSGYGAGIDDQRAARTSALRKSSTYKDAPKKSLFSFFGG